MSTDDAINANASDNIRQMQNEESLEVVLETMDASEVAIIKSLLEAMGIPYIARGEDKYDAFRGAFRGTAIQSSRPTCGFPRSRQHGGRSELLLQGDFQEKGYEKTDC